MRNSNAYGLDFCSFKGILETLIKVVGSKNKKKIDKPKFEEIKTEEKIDEQEESDFLSLKANEELSPLISYGLTANKDVNYLE